MSYSKWIGATLGWSIGGPIGAIIGLAIGSIIDTMTNNNQPLLGERQSRRQWERQQRRTAPRPQTKPGDFEVSLLVLASIVIKADNHQDQRELDFVRNHFVNMYGKERANNAFRLFKQISKQDISTRQVCNQIKQMMDHSSRLQLIHFLFGIAKADGHVLEEEVKQIYTIAGYLNISFKDFESIKAMFFNIKDNAYKILEINKGASVDEIKSAYRKMAKKYHPDKVTHLGEEHRKGAEEKFRQVQEAYETLQRELKFS